MLYFFLRCIETIGAEDDHVGVGFARSNAPSV
jgi:hypothetical protein